MRVPLLYLVMILLLSSCSTTELCDEDSISELVALFKTETGGEVIDTTLSNLRIYGIREGQSTWFLYDSVTTSDILLPLDPHHDHSSFVFLANGFSDTLTLSHSSEDYLISFSCGFGKLFTLPENPATYEGGMIKKDTLLYPIVSTSLEEDETHIWLWF